MRQAKYSTVRRSMMVLSLGLTGTMLAGCGSSDSTNDVAAVLDIGAAADATIADTFGATEDAVVNATVGLADCEVLVGSGTVDRIEGLYDESQGGDVSYLHVANDGTTTVYDYQQDQVDQGENCFLIHSGDSGLSALSDNRYLNLYYSDSDISCQTETQILTINRSENELAISYIDTEDKDGDDDLRETVTDTYPALAGLSVESFTRCE